MKTTGKLLYAFSGSFVFFYILMHYDNGDYLKYFDIIWNWMITIIISDSKVYNRFLVLEL